MNVVQSFGIYQEGRIAIRRNDSPHFCDAAPGPVMMIEGKDGIDYRFVWEVGAEKIDLSQGGTITLIAKYECEQFCLDGHPNGQMVLYMEDMFGGITSWKEQRRMGSRALYDISESRYDWIPYEIPLQIKSDVWCKVRDNARRDSIKRIINQMGPEKPASARFQLNGMYFA